LDVFQLADALVVRVYHATRHVPVEERYGLQRQVRRAATSVPCNIIEGCARRRPREYLHFVNIALGSAADTQYLLDLATRLEFLSASDATALCSGDEELSKKLQKLLQAIGRMEATTSDVGFRLLALGRSREDRVRFRGFRTLASATKAQSLIRFPRNPLAKE
jgi:four helix bundle protein